MGVSLFSPDLKGASLAQRGRILSDDVFGLGPPFLRAAIWAEIEDATNGTDPNEPVTPMDICELMRDLIKVKSNETRYSLLARPIPGDETMAERDQTVWFDIIPGLTEPPIIRGIARAAGELLPRHKSTWKHAADLGAATGKLGATLRGLNGAPRTAERVTMVDRSPSLLGVALDRYGEAADYHEGDVLCLPFEDNSFDLVVSSGLAFALDKDLQDSYFTEVSRLLEMGGLYIDGDYIGGSRLVESTYTNSGKYRLASMVKSIVSWETFGDPLRDVGQTDYFGQMGLMLSHRVYADDIAQTLVRMRILEKVG